MKYCLFAAVFVLLVIVSTQPSVIAQSGPVFTSCANGGLLYIDPPGTTASRVYRCIDPKTLQTPTLTGGPCTAPTDPTAIQLYAQLPDKTCLPIIAVPTTGSLAQKIDVTQKLMASNVKLEGVDRLYSGPYVKHQVAFISVFPCVNGVCPEIAAVPHSKGPGE